MFKRISLKHYWSLWSFIYLFIYLFF